MRQNNIYKLPLLNTNTIPFPLYFQASNSFKELNVKLSETNPDNLVVANKIVVSDMYSLDKTFAEAVQGYGCEFETMDFSKPEKAAAEINKWVFILFFSFP